MKTKSPLCFISVLELNCKITLRNFIYLIFFFTTFVFTTTYHERELANGRKVLALGFSCNKVLDGYLASALKMSSFSILAVISNGEMLVSLKKGKVQIFRCCINCEFAVLINSVQRFFDFEYLYDDFLVFKEISSLVGLSASFV